MFVTIHLLLLLFYTSKLVTYNTERVCLSWSKLGNDPYCNNEKPKYNYSIHRVTFPTTFARGNYPNRGVLFEKKFSNMWLFFLVFFLFSLLGWIKKDPWINKSMFTLKKWFQASKRFIFFVFFFLVGKKRNENKNEQHMQFQINLCDFFFYNWTFVKMIGSNPSPIILFF